MNAKRKTLCGETSGCGAKKSAADRVFETARRLFYNRGVRAVGVDEIVCEAGVTKPSLYRTYASKDVLVAACLDAVVRDNAASLDELLGGCASSDPRAQLRAVVGHFAARMLEPDFRGCALSNTAVEFPEPGHPGRTTIENGKAALRARLTGIARRLAVRDPAALADGLLLIIEGAMASHHVFGSQGPSAAMTATADALIAAHLAETARA